jgi:hypothetical protein
MITGSPPTTPKARARLFTPPGIDRQARAVSALFLVSFSSHLGRSQLIETVEMITERRQWNHVRGRNRRERGKQGL